MNTIKLKYIWQWLKQVYYKNVRYIFNKDTDYILDLPFEVVYYILWNISLKWNFILEWDEKFNQDIKKSWIKIINFKEQEQNKILNKEIKITSNNKTVSINENELIDDIISSKDDIKTLEETSEKISKSNKKWKKQVISIDDETNLDDNI